MVARKRQRGVLRQNYLANVPVADRDKIEKAARILDANLAAIWHRKRYSRRLRLVIEYEQPARARLSLIHGLASLAHLERDIIGKDAGNSDHGRRNKAETFELRHCGRILLEDFRLPAMRVPGTAALSQDPPSHDLFRFVMDSFQAIVQSIVLAARVGEWLQVLDSINQLWKIQRRLMRRNTLGGQDFRKNQLWRAWWVIGLCIIDFLQSVSVRKADGDDEATFAIAMPTSRPSTGRSFTYPSRPATATYAKIESAGNMLPFATMSEMTGHQFVAAWADRHGEMQMAFLDLPFLAQCCLFGIETMNAAKKYHRLMQFGLKFDQVFKGIYATILQPIMASAQQALQTRLGEDSLGQVSDQMDAWLDSQQYSTSPSQQLWFARGLSAEYRLGVLRSSTASVDFSDLYGDLTDAYEDTISLAEETKNRTLLVIAASEYADVLNASGDLDSACLFWSKAVDIIFNRQLVVGSWEQMFVAGDDWASENIPHYVSLTARAGGFRNLVLAATAVTKMVRARYAQIHLDKRQSLVSFAARTFSILLRGSLPHPANPVELAQYTPPFILPFLNIFSDCNRCDPWELVETLQFLGNELVITGRPWEAFPMGVLMEYMATHVCFSTPLICFARLIKAEALISLGNISDGLECFLSVSSGTALLADEKMFYAPPSSGAGAPLPSDVRYQDQVHLLDSLLNLRIIRYVADHALADRLIWFLGPDVARAFELTRCRILIKILEVAGLRDPGITSTKSAMLLHQEESPQESDSSEGAGEPSLDMFRQLSAGMRASTDSIVGAQTSKWIVGHMQTTAPD
ncbi:hypothetical protein HKX48_004726 [Thoreauomyces humboldtii]|nr:hypothetical protein HKX48_004726 [Thoreauomyces humboldtii]